MHTQPNSHRSMKHYITKHKAFQLLVLLMMMTTTAWGAETPYKTLVFTPATMSKGVSSYTDTWTATAGGFTWQLENFNNNNMGWPYVKCVRQNDASIGSITTFSAIDKAVTKVVVTIDAVTIDKVNSTTLEVATDASFTQNLQRVPVTIAQGDVTYTVTTPTANCYYRLNYDCASGSSNSNGLVTISKVVYYVEESTGPAAPTFSPNGGKVVEGATVTITAPEGCTIMYTTDGTDPYESSTATEVESTTATVTINETTTIKAIALDANLIPSEIATATFTVAELGAEKYVLVTDASTLQDGDEIIVVGKDDNHGYHAMSTTQNPNNRTAVSITLEEDGSIIATDKVAIIQLQKISDAWAMFVSNGDTKGYLYAASNSENRLKTSSIVQALAAITIDNNSMATVKFNGYNGGETHKRPYMRFNYNNGSPLFSCYSSESPTKQVSLYKKSVISSPKVTITAVGYGTMYYGDRNLIVPEGVRAHALTTNGNQLVITKTYAANDVIPAETAVMLVETTQPYREQQFRFVSTHTTGTAPANNSLQGTDEEETINETGYKYYMLTTTKSGVLGFYWQQGSNGGTAIMNAAHKAYLRVPTGADIKGFTFDNLVTGITAINGNGNTNGNDGWYTLDGRRLSGPPTQQGIYIHNGRKEVVK